jgi:type IV secretion system protein TrbD
MLQKLPFPRAFHRANLILGGERELVLVTAILAGALVVASPTWLNLAIALGGWLLGLMILRKLAQNDANLSRLYLRSLKYKPAYHAYSRPQGHRRR